MSAQSDRNVAQRPVIHIHAALPHDSGRVNAERVAEVQMVVNRGSQQIICGSDCVKITCKVQVQILHRDDLRIPAAGRATLHAKARAERRFSEREADFFAKAVQRVGKTDADRCFSLSRGRRIDRGHKNQFPGRRLHGFLHEAFRQLRLVFSVQLKVVVSGTDLFRDLRDRLLKGFLRNFNVCLHPASLHFFYKRVYFLNPGTSRVPDTADKSEAATSAASPYISSLRGWSSPCNTGFS